jgi:hypothetical protein
MKIVLSHDARARKPNPSYEPLSASEASLAQNAGDGRAIALGVAVAGEPGAPVFDQARHLLAVKMQSLADGDRKRLRGALVIEDAGISGVDDLGVTTLGATIGTAPASQASNITRLGAPWWRGQTSAVQVRRMATMSSRVPASPVPSYCVVFMLPISAFTQPNTTVMQIGQGFLNSPYSLFAFGIPNRQLAVQSSNASRQPSEYTAYVRRLGHPAVRG